MISSGGASLGGLLRWSVVLTSFLSCLAVLCAAAGAREFVGQLDTGIVVAHTQTIALKPTSSSPDAGLPVAFDKDDRFLEGTLPVPHLVGLPLGAPMRLVLLQTAGGNRALFADVNLDGHISVSERFSFSASRAPQFAAETVLKIVVPGPPQWLHPVLVLLPTLPAESVEPTTLAVAQTAFVQGSVQIDDRPTIVRLALDIGTDAIRTRGDYIGIDGNGDGIIDASELSREYTFVQRNEEPSDVVFRVGSRYVSIEVADVATRRLVLKERGASDYRWLDLDVGARLPDFSFIDLAGVQRRLSDVRAKYVLLCYCSVRCGPCMQEVPLLKAAHERFHALGFEILWLSEPDDVGAAVRDFVNKHNVAWPATTPETVRALVRQQLRFTSTPTMLLLGGSGTILSRNQSGELPLQGEQLMETLAGLLQSAKKARESPRRTGTIRGPS